MSTEGAASPLAWERVREEAVALIDAAEAGGLLLRLCGSAGVRLSSPEVERLLAGPREPPKDLDFVCRGADRNRLRPLFAARGYAIDRDMLIAMEGTRYAYRHSLTGLKLDLFVDRLAFCHTIELAGRLALHRVTISPDDLLLHKLQIVNPTAGDLLDIEALLLAAWGSAEPDTSRLFDVLCRDWGFCRTALANLGKTVAHAERNAPAALGVDASLRAAERATALGRAIEEAPKSLRWKLRASIGERVQWWQDVDDREGTY
jgi:hypothetical protein